MLAARMKIHLWSLVACWTTSTAQRPNPIFFPNANGNFHVRSQPAIPRLNTTADDEFRSRGNALQSIEDFANYFKVDLPAVDPFKPSVSISVRFGTVASDSGPVVEEFSQAVCTPELTAVPLDLPTENGISYFPTCIRIERCGGCCFFDHHSCQATESEIVMVKAVKVGESVTRSRRRRVRNAEPTYQAVAVERHLSCDCKCRLQESECNPAIHAYDEHRCACVCNDSAKEEACFASRDHFWNDNSCECLCRRTLRCSTGETFNHETCSCR